MSNHDPPAFIKGGPQHWGVRLGVGSVLDGNVQRITLVEPHKCTRYLLMELQ